MFGNFFNLFKSKKATTESKPTTSEKTEVKSILDITPAKATAGRNESLDKKLKAKRVGYRYTDARAKKLGVSPTAIPTKAHIEKYLGNGVYKEERRNHSDKSLRNKI